MESIPEDLPYPDGSPSHISTYQAWSLLLSSATSTIDISAYYWSLIGRGNTSDPTDVEVHLNFSLCLFVSLPLPPPCSVIPFVPLLSSLPCPFCPSLFPSLLFCLSPSSSLSPPLSLLSLSPSSPLSSLPLYLSLLLLSIYLSPSIPPFHCLISMTILRQGKLIFEGLVSAAARGVKIRVVQNTPTREMPDIDSQLLATMGAAEVRNLSITALTGYGILHTKMLVVDARHIYVGSANLDWRSLTQVWWSPSSKYSE